MLTNSQLLLLMNISPLGMPFVYLPYNNIQRGMVLGRQPLLDRYIPLSKGYIQLRQSRLMQKNMCPLHIVVSVLYLGNSNRMGMLHTTHM